MKAESFLLLMPLLIAVAGCSGNPIHDELMGMPDVERNKELTQVLDSSGHECDEVTRTFLQGRYKHDAVWNAECRNGKGYVITVYGWDIVGFGILDCAEMKDLPCFVKFKQAPYEVAHASDEFRELFRASSSRN